MESRNGLTLGTLLFALALPCCAAEQPKPAKPSDEPVRYTNADLEGLPPVTEATRPERRSAPPAAPRVPSPGQRLVQDDTTIEFQTPPASVPRPELGGVLVSGVRVGRGLDANGRVPDALRTDVLQWEDPVFAEVNGVPGGTEVGLTIVDTESNLQVWSDGQVVPVDQSFVTFSLDPGRLDPGRYRVEVYLGGERFASHAIAVSGGNA